MDNILNELLSVIDDNSLKTISKKAKASPKKTKNAMASAIPILMNALANNSSTGEGATALQRAIEKDHDGSLLDNLGDFLNNPDTTDGDGILKHVLGAKRKNVEKYISNDSGLSSSAVGKILVMLAPILLGYLGKKSSGGNGSILGDLLNSFINTENKKAPHSQNVISQILDRDNDGSIMDDIAELGKSFLGRLM